MFSCEQCNELLVDYVYGLLEDIELQETREHLRDCAACQAALEQVQAEQSLMARAAKAVHEVPEFKLPSGPETIVQAPGSAPSLPAPVAATNASKDCTAASTSKRCRELRR